MGVGIKIYRSDGSRFRIEMTIVTVITGGNPENNRNPHPSRLDSYFVLTRFITHDLFVLMCHV